MQPPDRSTSDFFSFWAGARLVGPHLYDEGRGAAIQHSVSPAVASKRYIRPPFYALALWPLGQLPFHTAYAIWFLLNLAALLAFAWAFRLPPVAIAACALFAPLAWSFGLGQDAPFMLCIIGLGVRLLEREHPLPAGALLALCAIKPHLFLFVPVALLALRRYRTLAAMAAGGAVLYLASSAVLGFAWPAAFLRTALSNEGAMWVRLLGVSGILAQFRAPAWVLAAVVMIGAVLVYRLSKAAACRPAIAYAVAAGVVFAPRSLLYDGALFLPALLLCLPPLAVVLTGIALLAAATPLPIIAELVSLSILWTCRPSKQAPQP